MANVHGEYEQSNGLGRTSRRQARWAKHVKFPGVCFRRRKLCFRNRTAEPAGLFESGAVTCRPSYYGERHICPRIGNSDFVRSGQFRPPHCAIEPDHREPSLCRSNTFRRTGANEAAPDSLSREHAREPVAAGCPGDSSPGQSWGESPNLLLLPGRVRYACGAIGDPKHTLYAIEPGLVFLLLRIV